VTFGTPEHEALLDALRRAGCVGQLSLDGEILLRAGGETLLIRPAERQGPPDGPSGPRTADAQEPPEGC
jgi:hypothetical protein